MSFADADQERICEVRRHTGWGPRLIAGVVGHPHSTVHRTLARHGISRPPRPKREQARRYEWPCPGDLLHMDTKRYARFRRPGHAKSPASRFTTGAQMRERVGYEFAHSIVDDHTRPGLLGAARRRAGGDGRRLHPQGAGLLRRARDPPEAADDRQRLRLHEVDRAAGAAPRRAPDPPHHHPRLAGRRPTARSSASSRRWPASGLTASPTAHPTTAPRRCHTGCATTTNSDPTQESGTGRRSAVFTTCRVRTGSCRSRSASPTGRRAGAGRRRGTRNRSPPDRNSSGFV